MTGKKDQECLCEVDRKKIRFIWTDVSVSLQTIASIEKDTFDVWKLDEEDIDLELEGKISFAVNLVRSAASLQGRR